ncbi:MAG: hypothetical protein NDJ92_01970 [Thermoanaerobaculia bacterium]|nr:hypothetical protein [Thermoanaerobaculia bacterium]
MHVHLVIEDSLGRAEWYISMEEGDSAKARVTEIFEAAAERFAPAASKAASAKTRRAKTVAEPVTAESREDAL